MRVIPIYARAGLTGFESPAEEYRELELSLEQLLIAHPSATFLGLVQGDSMEGRGIYEGDVLVVDRSLREVDDDVIVGTYNGEFVCKIINVTHRLLLSANEKYQSQTIHDYDNFKCEGVVTSSFRLHRFHAQLHKLLCSL